MKKEVHMISISNTRVAMGNQASISLHSLTWNKSTSQKIQKSIIHRITENILNLWD